MKAWTTGAFLCAVALAVPGVNAHESSKPKSILLDFRATSLADDHSFADDSSAAPDWRDPDRWHTRSDDDIAKWLGGGRRADDNLDDDWDDHHHISAVPEASSWQLLALGVVLLSAAARRATRRR